MFDILHSLRLHLYAVVESTWRTQRRTAAGPRPRYLSASLLDLRSYTEVQESVDKYLDKGFSYSRTNNPTVSTSLARAPRRALGKFWNLLMSGGTFPGTPCGNPESTSSPPLSGTDRTCLLCLVGCALLM